MGKFKVRGPLKATIYFITDSSLLITALETMFRLWTDSTFLEFIHKKDEMRLVRGEMRAEEL
jgi:hypothetical protein